MSLHALAALMLATSLASGQAPSRGEQAEGVVVRSGRPAPGVVVRLVCHETILEARTDAIGRYRFEGIPAGVCMLSAGRGDERTIVSLGDDEPLPAILDLSGHQGTDAARREQGQVTGDASALDPGSSGFGFSTQFDFGASRFAGQPGAHLLPQIGNPNAPWKFSGRVDYVFANGTRTMFRVVGHRGYAMPLFMTETMSGMDLALPLGSFTDMTQRRTQWEISAGIEKILKETERGTTMGVLGEVFMPLNNVSQVEWLPDGGSVHSKGAKVGLRFTFDPRDRKQ